MKMEGADLIHWIEEVNKQIKQHKSDLTKLDQAIGDGDHGINLVRGFEAVLEKLMPKQDQDLGAICQEIGMTLVTRVSGAAGPLYGTAFLKMAQVWKGKNAISWVELAQGIDAAAQGMKTRGRCKLGDKTLLDVWLPLADFLLQQGENASWEELEKLAFAKMEYTKTLEARRGRAAFLGSRSIGHLDPGAVSSYLIFRALAQVMKAKEME